MALSSAVWAQFVLRLRSTFLVSQLSFVCFNLPYMMFDDYGWCKKHLICEFACRPSTPCPCVRLCLLAPIVVLRADAKSTSSQERWAAWWMLVREHLMVRAALARSVDCHALFRRAQILLPILALAFPLFPAFGFTTSAASFPTLQKFAIQFVVFNVIEDTLFYWIHRLLHTQWLYQVRVQAH